VPRIDIDETWEQQPDGSMRLLRSEERTLSDEAIARLDAPATLRALLAKPSLRAGDLEVAVRAIAHLLLPPGEAT